MNNKKELNDTTTAFALPVSLMDKIKSEAEKEDRTPSYIIRRIIRNYYGGYKTYLPPKG